MATAITYENFDRCSSEIKEYFQNRGYNKSKLKVLSRVNWGEKKIMVYPSFFSGECMLHSGEIIIVESYDVRCMYYNWRKNKLKWETYFLDHIQPILLKHGISSNLIKFKYN